MTAVSNQVIRGWIEQFHRDGFLVVPSVLSGEQCAQLRLDLAAAYRAKGRKSGVLKRLFENSRANLELFWQEPIVTFAERLIADNGSDEVHYGEDLQAYSKGLPSANEVHVIHNNGFVIRAESAGLGDSSWHQDDTPHITSLDGRPLENVRLNVLAITCLYYLTDVLDVEHGPTQAIRGSHLFGVHCTNERAERHTGAVLSALGTEGTCVIVNNQTWHRGAPNQSKEHRQVTQVTYAKRLIGHKYGSFMNYQMPEHVWKNGFASKASFSAFSILKSTA